MAYHGMYPVTADADLQVGMIPGIHQYIQCPCDNMIHEDLMTYATKNVLVDTASVPGSSTNAPVARSRSSTLMLLRRWFNSLWLAHKSGVCMEGRFTLFNFLVNTSTDVRLTGVHLVSYCKDLATLDYEQFVICVELFFACGKGNALLPPDIARWLQLIREGACGNEYLIRYNVALMNPRQAWSFLMEARDLLERIRANPQTQSQSLYAVLLARHTELNGWTNRSCKNRLFSAARAHVDPLTNQVVQYEANLRGVLKLWRDTRHHPAVWLEESMMLIIEEDFPGVAAAIQRSFFRSMFLQSFQLESLMA